MQLYWKKGIGNIIINASVILKVDFSFVYLSQMPRYLHQNFLFKCVNYRTVLTEHLGPDPDPYGTSD